MSDFDTLSQTWVDLATWDAVDFSPWGTVELPTWDPVDPDGLASVDDTQRPRRGRPGRRDLRGLALVDLGYKHKTKTEKGKRQ